MKAFFYIITLLLLGCEHYSSNVEVVYKNSKGAGYQNSGSDFLKPAKESNQNSGTKSEAISFSESYSKQETAELSSLKMEEIKEDPAASIDAEVKPAPAPKTAPVSNFKAPENRDLEGSYHVAQKGETYYSIARLYFLDPKSLMGWNGYKEPAVLYPGTIIKLYKNEASNLDALQSAEPLRVKKDGNGKTNPSAKNLKTQISPQEKANTYIASGSGKCGESFKMPISINNKVLVAFGDAAKGGVKADGVTFKVSSEEFVRAAANGEVAYVGDGFSDYGNIVIVKHGKSYFSIYGYLADIRLKKGQMLMKGDKISNTSKTEGKFYFSIRKGKNPINPKTCL